MTNNFHRFFYCDFTPPMHRRISMIGWGLAVAWLYWSLVEKAYFVRMMKGELALVDMLVGLPLVIALAPVLYGLFYWLMKWIALLFIPGWLDCSAADSPEED